MHPDDGELTDTLGLKAIAGETGPTLLTIVLQLPLLLTAGVALVYSVDETLE